MSSWITIFTSSSFMWFFKRDTLPKPRFQPSPSQAHINDQTAFSVLSPLLPKCLILIIYKRSAWSASVITAAWEGDVDVAFHDTWRDAALSKSQPSWSCTRLTVTPFRLEYRIPFSTAWLSEIHPAILHNLISILNRCDFLFGRKKLILRNTQDWLDSSFYIGETTHLLYCYS